METVVKQTLNSQECNLPKIVIDWIMQEMKDKIVNRSRPFPPNQQRRRGDSRRRLLCSGIYI